MNDRTARRVLAVGFDAVESTLVQSMLADGELPMLQKLCADGEWSTVVGPAAIGSGVVWPTFFTGTDAAVHGVYAHWAWDPATMGLSYYDAGVHTPFWRAMVEDGVSVGVVDVPFAPHLGLERGFEVLEWGAHDWVDGHPSVSPPAVAEQVSGEHAQHPFGDPLAAPPQDVQALSRQSVELVAGARLRGDLAVRLLGEQRPDVAIVIFTEAHRGGHYLWHTVDRDLPMYDDVRHDPQPANDLRELYRELDAQIARLVAAVPEDTSVIVFALHGMGPGRGVPSVLEPLLAGMGLSHVDDRPERLRGLLAAAKRRMPTALRDLYRRTVPLATRSQWGKASLLPAYDWSRTQALSLPTDQYGWIRVNLAGRESRGVVAAADYPALLDRIESEIRALRTTDGHPVAARVVRPPRRPGRDLLPDLVVHWTPESFEAAIPVHGTDTVPTRREETGKHTTDGFCIVHSPVPACTVGDTVQAKDLHTLISAALNG